MTEPLSYKASGVDIDAADAMKKGLAASLETPDPRVLNRVGAFASLVDGRFDDMAHPVLVLKMEEPGSKQKIAFAHDRVESLCQDLIHHLIDDIIVMGARPVAVQDCVICGHMDGSVVSRLVKGMAAACRANGCSLVGGETSEQPGVVDKGLYILSASIVGVVDRDKIIDGAAIRDGDVVLAAASNGLHTNGYSLVRALMASRPQILDERVGEVSFLDAILAPHTCYFRPLEALLTSGVLHGLAHITGGGIEGNLNRILPAGLDARIDRSKIRILDVFRTIRRHGGVDDADMFRTFNLGAGLTIVVSPGDAEAVQSHLCDQGVDCYPIGTIAPGDRKVVYEGAPAW